LISWKHSFKRLNEEYDIAKRKQQALDKLYASGKISQSTRDSFDNELVSAIAEIEKQQKDLLAKMETKVSELRSQIQTLEMLLANYEIQHVVGEIEEDTYQREITLLSTGLDTAKHELDVIKEAASQLCPTAAPATLIPEPTPEIAAQIPEDTALPTPEPENIPIPTVENVTVAPEVEATPAPADVETPLLCSQEPAQAEPESASEPVQEEAATEISVEAEPEAEIETVVEAPVEMAEDVTEMPIETVETVLEPDAEIAEASAEITVEPTMEATEISTEVGAEDVVEAQIEDAAEITEETSDEVMEIIPETMEIEEESISENSVEATTETPQIETIMPDNSEPIEKVFVEAHPTEAPKEAHPEIIVEPTEAEDIEEVQQPVVEASSEESCESQDS
jgi:CdvA-like coiled-coil domain